MTLLTVLEVTLLLGLGVTVLLAAVSPAPSGPPAGPRSWDREEARRGRPDDWASTLAADCASLAGMSPTAPITPAALQRFTDCIQRRLTETPRRRWHSAAWRIHGQ